MNKIQITILWICLALIIAAFGTAVYRFCLMKSVPLEATQNEQVLSILKLNDCFVCHSSDAQLPFYASFPIIGSMMNEHIVRAQKNFSLDKYKDGISNFSEADISQMLYTVAMDDMPISQYKMIHWGTGFDSDEKAILTDWIDYVNSKYSNGLASYNFKNEPIQPIVDAIDVDSDKAALGFKLYYDTRLSKDGTISCASCHILEKGGVSNPAYRTSEGINGQFGGVNAPTVYNAYFNVQQFWNGRAANLAEQAAGPPVNPVEMGDWSWDDIVNGLRKDKALVREFDNLYPGEGLTASTVCNAIAEFEKTLITPNAPFDRYLKGDSAAVTELEKEGYELFKQNKCATCHAGQAIGGLDFAYLGIHNDYFADRDSSISCGADDRGLASFTGNASDEFKFKTPTLRNVALTAPYFHDGSQATLEDAVKAMFKYESGTSYFDSDIESIVAFLNSLTGENKYMAK